MTAAAILDRITAMYSRSFGYDGDVRATVARTRAALESGQWLTARAGAASLATTVGGELGKALRAAVTEVTADRAAEFDAAWTATLERNAGRYDG